MLTIICFTMAAATCSAHELTDVQMRASACGEDGIFRSISIASDLKFTAYTGHSSIRLDDRDRSYHGQLTDADIRLLSSLWLVVKDISREDLTRERAAHGVAMANFRTDGPSFTARWWDGSATQSFDFYLPTSAIGHTETLRKNQLILTANQQTADALALIVRLQGVTEEPSRPRSNQHKPAAKVPERKSRVRCALGNGRHISPTPLPEAASSGQP